MQARFVVSRVVGTTAAWEGNHPAVMDFPTGYDVGWRCFIATDALGAPVRDWCIVKILAQDSTVLNLPVNNADFIPFPNIQAAEGAGGWDTPLNTAFTGQQLIAARNRIQAAFPQLDLSGVTGATTLRQIARAIGRHIDPSVLEGHLQ